MDAGHCPGGVPAEHDPHRRHPVPGQVDPEDVRVRGLDDTIANRVTVEIAECDFMGSFCRALLVPDAMPVAVIQADFSINLMRDFAIEPGNKLVIALPSERLRIYSRD